MNNRGLGRTMVRLPADTQAAQPQIILSIKYVPLLIYDFITCPTLIILMKFQSKFYVLLVCFLPFVAAAQKKGAATEDVMYLKNGSVLRGKVVESSRDTVVRIQILGGSIFAHSLAEIDTLAREQAIKENEYFQYASSIRRQKIDLSALKGTWFHHTNMKISVGYNQNQPVGVIALQHSSGYFVKPWLGIGAGASIERNAGHTLMPIFASFRGILSNTPNSFYYSCDVGYNVAFMGQDNNWGWRTMTMTKAQGGIYIHPAVGIRFFSPSRLHFTLDVGYVFQKVSYTYTGEWNPEPYTEHNTWLRPALRLGVMF
jgi:hypothetical protein